MTLRVIVPPAPIMTPAEIAGDHAADDARIVALIAEAQEQIDGPEGWVGRAFGPQTLALSAQCFEDIAGFLPCPPVIEVLAITYQDMAGAAVTLPTSVYSVDAGFIALKPGQCWPRAMARQGAVTVRYRCGYDGVAVADGGTGPIPAGVKGAIVLAVRYAQTIGAENLFLRSEDVADVGARQYTVSTVAGDLIDGMIRHHLSGLRNYR